MSNSTIPSFRRISLIFLVTIITCSIIQGQEQPDAPADEPSKPINAEPPKLEPVFSDDFSKDTRGDYTIKGDVSWEEGRLTLAEGASIERAINGGSWAKITLRLEPVELNAEQPESEVRVWFNLEGATPCYGRLLRKLDAGKAVSSIALVDTGEKDGKPIQQLVRVVMPCDQAFGAISVEYRNGLVRVGFPEGVSFAAYVENGNATVASVAAEFTGSSVKLNSFVTSATRLNVRQFTDAEKNQLATATANDSRELNLQRQGQFAEAAKIREQSHGIRKSVLGEQHPSYAESLNNLAFLYNGMGNYARSEPLLKQAIEIQKSVLGEYHPIYAVSLNNLATQCYRTGDYARAEPLFKLSRDIRRIVLGERHPLYATSVNNLALLHKSVGDYYHAEQLYKLSGDIRKSVLGEQHPHYATSLNNLASLYVSMGDYGRAEQIYEQAIDISKSMPGEEHPEYATFLSNLAGLYMRMGKYAGAEQFYWQSLEIRKSVFGEQHAVYAQSLNNLAALYLTTGDYRRAEPLFKQSFDIRRSVLSERHPDFATCLNNLAALYFTIGDYALVEPLFRQSRDIRESVLGAQHPSYAESLNNLTLLFYCMDNYASGEPQVIAARNVLVEAATRSIPSLSGAQARNWIMENAPRSGLVLSILRRSRQFQSPEAYATLWQTKLMVSRLRVGRELPPNSSPEASEVFGQLRDARLNLAKLVSATPNPEQADGYRKALAAVNEKKEELEKELASLNPASKRELAIRDASIEDLLKQLPHGVAVVDFSRLNDWEFVDKEIELKWEDGRTEKRTVKKPKATPVYDAFVLRTDRRPAPETPATWVQLGPAEPIELALAEWRKKLSPEKNSSDVTESTTATQSRRNTETDGLGSPSYKVLRELIWDKLEPHLDGIHTVVIIPDGALNGLPWAALPGRNANEYLIHDYTLTTAASGQQLFGVLSDPPFETEPSLLVAGGIQYDERPAQPSVQDTPDLFAARSRTLDVANERPPWTYLGGTAIEARAIAELWADRGPITRLEGLQADERTLASLLPQSRFVLLATHGFFDTKGEVYGKNLREQSLFESSLSGSQQGASVAYRNPLLMTGIVMAGANVPPDKDEYGLPIGDDGILTAEEISGLDLRNTELVTLSACETGLGDVAAGQGVFGLTRVLHQSGVRSVVASLWQVDDRATLELMKLFYTNLWINKQSKIDALRNAQLTMVDRYDLPTGKLRSLGQVSVKIDPNKTPETNSTSKNKRLDPRYWAAFQLSGDWR